MSTSDEPDVRHHKGGWIVLTCLVAVSCAFLLFFIGWYRGYRDWHKSRAAPLFSDIEPADGATVYASDAWIRWASPIGAKGRVLWRKAGSSGTKSVDAGSGEQLLAHVASLISGSKYEYIVEETDSTQTLRSSVRTLNVVSGLSFDPVIDQTVDRDYDQTVKLTLHNRGSQSVKVAARALKQYEDLPSDITGYGSVEVPATIGPNSTQDLRLAVTAADAKTDIYQVPIEAAGAYVLAKFHVRRPKLDLAFSVIGDDPETLAKTVEIHNNGDTLTDLSVHVAKENESDVALEPSINHLRLNSQASIRITATPALFLEFESLNAQIEAKAAGQGAPFPLAFRPRPGMHLIAFRSASTFTSSARGGYCSNNPNTCSNIPSPPGNGAASTEPTDQGLAHVLDLNDGTILSASMKPKVQVKAKFQELRKHEPTLLRIRAHIVDPLLHGDAAVSATGASRCDKPSTGDELPAPAACGNGKCSSDKYVNCFSKARELMEDYAVSQQEYIGWEYMLGNQDPNNPNVCGGFSCSHVSQNIDELRAHLIGLEASYNGLRSSCMIDCSISLPDNISATPAALPSLGDIARHATEAERVDDLHLPLEFSTSRGKVRWEDLTCEEQDEKAMAEFAAQFLESYALKAETMDGVGSIVIVAVILTGATEGLALPLIVGALAISGLSYPVAIAYLDDVAKDPPSMDFRQIVQPDIPDLQVVIPNNDVNRLAVQTIIGSRWELACLKSWLASYERYQGALIAHDHDAVARQLNAMLGFTTSGLQAAREAAASRLALRRAILQAARPRMSTGIDWNDVLSRYRRNPINPRDLAMVMGVPEQNVEKFLRNMESLTPARADAAFASLTERLGSGTLGRGIYTADVSDVILQDTFTRLQQRSQTLLNSLDVTHQNQMNFRPPTKTRAGLVAALARRASFTRAHRGRIAAPPKGNTVDSSSGAASWYGAQYRYFAWQQNRTDIVFAGFDAAGAVAIEPRLIGRGRWPHITGMGNRVAVAWTDLNGGDSVVRLCDDRTWSSEISVHGSDADVAFAPDGTLYMASSRGLSKLKVDHVQQVNSGNYTQPALLFDQNETPHVAFVENGRVLYDGTDMGVGEQPSMTVSPEGIIYLAYITRGSLVVRTFRNGQWTAPSRIAADRPSSPTLALDASGNVRLSYIGPSDYGPDATWLIRLPDERAIMLPSLVGNVSDSWLTTTFNLNQPRNHFRPHDLLLTVNDIWTKMFRNTIPEGRYLYRLNPNQVFTSSGTPRENRVAIYSWHMNRGHYSSITEYQLGVRTAWSEHYVFATDEVEARRSISGEHVNHDRPDLGLFANAADLPIEMPKPRRINIPILIANLGETPSTPTRLVMYRGERTTQELASAPVPAIKQGQEKNIVMPLDYDGKMPSISFRLENNKDFDPSNDELKLVLWEPLPTAYDGPDPNLSGAALMASTKVPLELKVTIAGEPVPQYKVVDAFTGRMFARVVNGEQYGSLRSGTYHVSVQPYSGEGQELLFDQDIQHQAGALQQVDLKSGIKIEPQDLAAKMSRWSAIRTDNPGTTVQWQSGSHSFMALAPAEYLIEFQPSGASAPVLWPQKIQVQPGQQAILNINSGLLLEIPQQLVTNLSHWRVVHAGNPAQVVQELDAKNRTIILPPGDYQVSTAGVGSEYQWVTWPQKVQVQPGQQATFTINSGIRLDVPQKLQPDLAHWRVVNLGNPAQGVELDAKNRTIILPPGDYQVSTAGVGSEYQWVTWPQKVQVQPGQQATFTINSDIRLDMPQEIASKLSRWRVLHFGNEQSMVELDANHQTMVLPPGDYQISTAGVGNEYNYLVWPQKIQVQFGKDSSVKLDCGIRLTGPGSERGYRFSLKDERGRNIEEWGSEMLQLVPPGKYSVEGYSKSLADWKTIQNNVVVKSGSVTEITVPVLQQSSDQNMGVHH